MTEKKKQEWADKLMDEEQKLERLHQNFLREAGWEYTCEIASLWLWKKLIGDKTVMVGMSDAIWIEERL